MGMVARRYDVVLVNLDPTVGKEIHKTRPAIVVSPDQLNKHWAVVIIVPLTSVTRDLDFRVPVSFQGKNGHAAVDQIGSIDKSRIVKNLGKISREEGRRLFQIIDLMFQTENA